MINRQSCYSALFKLKEAGEDITEQLTVMSISRGVPKSVIEFLMTRSPQFQFYKYLQKYQKSLSKSILDYENLSNEEKIIACSSLITRAYLAVKYKNISKVLIDDLDLSRLASAISKALISDNFYEIDQELRNHKDSLKLFFKSREDAVGD